MGYNKTTWRAKDIITREKMQKIEDELEALSNADNLNIHICNNNEYNASGVPTIQNPDESTIYLTPGGNNNNDTFTEWIYVNNAWEKFGNGNVQINIPTNVSAFTNDAGYLTSHQDISGKANSADLAAVATSGSYNDLTNKPTIPTLGIVIVHTTIENVEETEIWRLDKTWEEIYTAMQNNIVYEAVEQNGQVVYFGPFAYCVLKGIMGYKEYGVLGSRTYTAANRNDYPTSSSLTPPPIM